QGYEGFALIDSGPLDGADERARVDQREPFVALHPDPDVTRELVRLEVVEQGDDVYVRSAEVLVNRFALWDAHPHTGRKGPGRDARRGPRLLAEWAQRPRERSRAERAG